MDEDTSRQTLRQRYESTRQLSLALVEPLSEEDCLLQSMPDASPSKWHLAHTTWFFETFILKKHSANYHELNAHYQLLFNSYYNAIGDQFSRPDRGVLSRPSLAEIKAYRQYVDEQMQVFIGEQPLSKELRFTIELGIHHEQQHQELLLMDIKHAFSCNPMLPAYIDTDGLVRAETDSALSETLQWQTYEPGLTAIGHSDDTFCFDNEKPQHPVYVAPFRLAERCVSNQEYAEFIADGGYDNPLLWHADGWAQLQQCRSQYGNHPMYWRQREGQWQEFTLRGLQPLNPQTPVCHISFYEASAYARWCGKRLPTEFEWEAAARQQDNKPPVAQYLQLDILHPTADGSRALLGGCWEWTASSYSPYPGFKPFAGEAGEYNGKFMVGQYVLRGGSCLTPKSHNRISYRNFFYPHHNWQMSGIRLAEDLQ